MFQLQIDNDDIRSIGFVYHENDESVGPRSILLHGNSIYLTDPRHGNVKSINISDGSIRISRQYFQPNPNASWLNDITVCGGNIWVSSDRDSLFVMNFDFAFIASIPAVRGKKNFIVKDVEQCEVYNYFEGTTIVYGVDKEILQEITSDYVVGQIFDFSKGSMFKIAKGESTDQIITQYGTVNLGRKYKSLVKYYDGYNVDYDDKRLVYFELDIENARVLIYLYEYRN